MERKEKARKTAKLTKETLARLEEAKESPQEVKKILEDVARKLEESE